jgi:hypothetical protein
MVALGAACAAPQGPKPPPSNGFGDQRAAGYPQWKGDFPDGSAIWDAATGKYYAYATPTGGRNLPIMSSTDLKHWYERPVYAPYPTGANFADPAFNDGMTKPAVWAWELPNQPGAWDDYTRKVIWSPDIAQFGSIYVDFYATVLSDGDGNPATINDEKFCITYATSASPLGPFRDNTTGPMVCGDKAPPGYNTEPSDNPNGSIDPSVTFDAAGNAYLLWKNSGAAMNGSNTRIMVRQLAATKTHWAPGFAFASFPRELLATANCSWMGCPGGIEQPSMIQYHGAWLLFFSGASTYDASYATGYAHCNSPLGPCANLPDLQPLMSTWNSPHWGPGGADAFLDKDGVLRLDYHYWGNNNPGYVNTPNGVAGSRPMTIAALWMDSKIYLHVSSFDPK